MVLFTFSLYRDVTADTLIVALGEHDFDKDQEPVIYAKVFRYVNNKHKK